MYIVVSIGNSDDRLTQKEWNKFVEEMIDLLADSGKVHFFGGASTFAPWQNVAWIVELREAPIAVMARVSTIREKYKQDSAFVMVEEGQFI
jgi:hypothetical protein